MALPNKVITDKLISENNPQPQTDLETITLTSVEDIRLLLKKVYKAHSLLTISFESSDACFGSTIIEINDDELYFVIDELYPEEGHNMAEIGKKLMISAHHAGAFIYFSITIEAIGTNEKAAYYKLGMPEEVEFHQRRNTYRVSTGVSQTIPVNLVSDDEVLITAELRDISIGGVSLRINDIPHITLQRGDYIPTCLIQVSENRKILSSLNICHIETMKASGSLRVGAEFASISKIDQREVEHLIAYLDREIIKKIKRADTRIAI